MLLGSFYANAQVYFQHLYPTTTTSGPNEVCSAVCTSQGLTMPVDQYIIGSYQTTPNTGNYNFEIRKLDELGQYSVGWTPPYYHISFFNGYNVLLSNVPMENTHGISVIETGQTPSVPGPNFAVAGAVSNVANTSRGYFFLILNVDGLVTFTKYYELPSSASNLSKPLLIEDVTNTGNYIVLGSYYDSNINKTKMYGFSLNTLVTNWELEYECDEALVPYGLLQSPFNPAELVVAGLNQPDPSLNRRLDGFFMKLDPATGFYVPGSCQIYGDQNSQFFTSLTVANSPWGGGPGFAIGGVSDPVGGFGDSWMIKVDQTGTIIWNTLITGTSATNKEITGIIERQNTSGDYEYYGATSTGMAQMTVFKLDHTGALFTAGTGENEFEYTLAGGGPAFITKTSAGAASGDGIQVFGTDVSGGTSDTYMVKAYYNGYSGCNESINIIGSQGPGPSQPLNPPVLDPDVTMLNPELTIDDNFNSTAAFHVDCSGSSVPGGSNARLKTGIIESERHSGAGIYPVPASEMLTITFTSKKSGEMQLRLYDARGTCVFSGQERISAGKCSITIPVSGLAEGVYSLNCSLNDEKRVNKIVVQH